MTTLEQQNPLISKRLTKLVSILVMSETLKASHLDISWNHNKVEEIAKKIVSEIFYTIKKEVENV